MTAIGSQPEDPFGWPTQIEAVGEKVEGAYMTTYGDSEIMIFTKPNGSLDQYTIYVEKTDTGGWVFRRKIKVKKTLKWIMIAFTHSDNPKPFDIDLCLN